MIIGKTAVVKDKRHRAICQYSVDGDLIAEYDCIATAAELYKYAPGLIRRNCKGKLAFAHGFIWLYKDEETMLHERVENIRTTRGEDLEGEIWRNIDGFANYQVSNYGRVKCLDLHIDNGKFGVRFTPGHICKQFYQRRGYLAVNLSQNGMKKRLSVHRLVAKAFLPNPNNLPMVNHKDENPGNNRLDNLEWCDAKYNSNYGTAPQRKIEGVCKAVDQYDLDGNFIKRHKSVDSAAKSVGVSKSLITVVCQGRPQHKTARGYKWKYAV